MSRGRRPTALGRRALSGSASVQTARVIALDSKGDQIGKSAIDAAIGGTDAEPSADLTLALSDLGVKSTQVGTLAGKLALALRTLPLGRALVFEGEGTLAHAANLAAAGTWSAAGHYGLDGRESELTQLAVEADGIFGARKWRVEGHRQPRRGESFHGEAGFLSSFLGVDLSGSGRFEAEARRAVASAPWAIVLAGRIEKGAVEGTSLAPLGETLNVDARANRAADGTLDIPSLQVTGEHIRASAQGRALPTLSLEAVAQSDLAAFGALTDVAATGPVTIRLDAQGTLDAPQIAVAAESESAVIEGLALGDLVLTLAPQVGKPFPAGMLRLRSKSALAAGDIAGPFARSEDGGYRLGPIQGLAFDGEIAGMLALSKDDDFTGRLDARFATLRSALALVLGEDVGAEGQGTLAVTFAAKPSVEATLEANGFAMRDIVTANTLKASYARADHADTLSVDARRGSVAMAAGGAGNSLEFRALSFSMQGPSKARRVMLEAQTLGNDRGMLKLGGTLASLPSSRRLTLDALDANLWDTPLHLVAPTAATKSETGFAHRAHAAVGRHGRSPSQARADREQSRRRHQSDEYAACLHRRRARRRLAAWRA